MSDVKNRSVPIPYEVIVKATNGEPDAVGAVVNAYSHYMNTLSTRHSATTEKYGTLDEEMRSRLELKLIAKILLFDAER